MKKEYNFSKLKELKNPYAGKKKAVGINLAALPEVDRSLSSGLREEAQEIDDEVGGLTVD